LGTVNIGELRIDGKLAPQEYRNRQALLDKVKQSWLSLLERSLINQARLELGLEQRFDALALDYETPEHPRQPLPKGTKVSEKFFDRLGVGRTLLILGAPGSGKTTTLLELARDLSDRVEQEGYSPLPVVLNLSSWAAKQENLDQWILQELGNSPYSVPKKLAKDWLKEEQLILFLDGLDEVKSEARNACVTAINQFKQTYGQTDIIVCSRTTDYENLTNRLQFQAAIFIQPLTPTQIEDYLNQSGNSLAGVKQALQTDTVLQELVQAPLMLSIIALAYESFPPEAFPQTSFEKRQEHLWNKYIQRMLERRKSKQYSEGQTVRWLKFLAQRMIQESKMTFLLEQIQPTWLQTITDQTRYRDESILILSLIIALITGVINGLRYVVKDGLISGIRDGLVVAILFGLLSGLIGRKISKLSKEIETVELLNWSWKEFILGAKKGLYCLPFLLLSRQGWLENLASTVLFIAFLGLIRGLKSLAVEVKTYPNEGIQRSTTIWTFTIITFGLINGLTTMTSSILNIDEQYVELSGGLISLLISNICFGLVIGIVFGLRYGGAACINHFALRFILYRQKLIPWNYARFLDECCDRLLLQRVGGGYIFMHRLLMEHFAQMEVDKL